MKKLIFALSIFAGLAAFAPDAEAKSKRVVVNNYYNYDRGYGGRVYRGGCDAPRYRDTYYAPAPVYYAPSYYAPRYVEPCRTRYYSRPRVAVSFGF